LDAYEIAGAEACDEFAAELEQVYKTEGVSYMQSGPLVGEVQDNKLRVWIDHVFV
jgi:hypothetical protein